MDQNDRNHEHLDPSYENQPQARHDAPLDATGAPVAPPDAALPEEPAPATPSEETAPITPSHQEQSSPRKRSKLPWILSLSITGGLLSILIPLLIILWPIMTLNPFANTVDAIFFDTDAAQELLAALETSAASTEVSVKLPGVNNRPYALELAVRSLSGGKKQPDTGKTTLVLSCAEQSVAVTVWWNEESVVLEGLSAAGAISLPRHGADQALERSIFHPDSKSKYAMERESYEQLAQLLRLLDDRAERKDDDVTERLNEILNDWSKCLEPKNNYFFDKNTHKLCKTVTYTLTDIDVAILLDRLIEEFEEELTDFALTPAQEGDPENMLEFLKQLRVALEPTTFTFSYTVKERKLSFLKLVYESRNAQLTDHSELWLTFLYGEECGIDVEMLVEQKTARTESSDATAAKLRKAEKANKTIFTYKGNNTITIRGQGAGYRQESFEYTFTYQNENERYLLEMSEMVDRCTDKTELGITETRIEGILSLSDKAFFLSADALEVNGEVECEELLEISASLCESAPDLTPPDAELLFEMSEKTMDRYLEQSYVDRLLAVWAKYYGQ